MPIVRIDVWSGRTPEQKQALIRNVTDAVVTSIGCPEQAVEVLLNEVDKSNWASGGVVAYMRSLEAGNHPAISSKRKFSMRSGWKQAKRRVRPSGHQTPNLSWSMGKGRQ